MRRARAELIEALCEVRSIQEEERRKTFLWNLPENVRAVLAFAGSPKMFAQALLQACLDHGRLGVALRWLRHEEGDSLPVQEVLAVASPLLLIEERKLFDLTEDASRAGAWKDLRESLRGLPFDEVDAQYNAAGRETLMESETPSPVNGWEAFLDLYDHPVVPGRPRSTDVFVRQLAKTTADSDLAWTLRRWIESTAESKDKAWSTEPDRPRSDSAADSAADRVPARLIVEITPDPGDPDRFQALHWTVLSPDRESDPDFSSRNVEPHLTERELSRYIARLVRMVDNHPRRRNHEKLRLEFIFPFSLLFRFRVPSWDLEAPERIDPPRLGGRYEMIFRSREFTYVDPEHYYRSSREYWDRRWKQLERSGCGLVKCPVDIPEESRVSEYLVNERIVAFVAHGDSDDDRENEVMAAVYYGVPVVAWCTTKSRREPRGRFRPVLAAKEDKVLMSGIRNLPTRMHAFRSGHGEPEEREAAGDSYDLSVICHDSLPVLPEREGRLSTANTR